MATKDPSSYSVNTQDETILFEGPVNFFCQATPDFDITWGLERHHIHNPLPTALIPFYQYHVQPYGQGYPESFPNALDVLLHRTPSIMPSLHDVRLSISDFALHPDGYIRFNNQTIMADFFSNGYSRHRILLPVIPDDILSYQQIHTLMRTYLIQNQEYNITELYHDIPHVTFEKILLQQELKKMQFVVPISELQIV